MHSVALTAFQLSALAANHAEVTSSNLNGGTGHFDNLKASWGKVLNVGDFKTNLRASYDHSICKDFLKEVSFSGDLVEAESEDDIKVGYQVTRNFQDKNTDVKLTATTRGTDFNVEYDTASQLKEVGASRNVEVGEQNVQVNPSWLVQAKTARVKMMSVLGGGRDSVSAQVDYDTNAKSTTYEVGYNHNMAQGRDVRATLVPEKRDLEVEYVDSNFEKGATWTATANVNLDSAQNNLLDAAELKLKRAWNW